MGSDRWLEVSFTVEGEIAEAVSEVMSRYIASGVVIENQVKYKDDNITTDKLDLARVYGYIPVDDRLIETRRSIEEGIWHLSQIVSIPDPQYRNIENKNWMDAWKKNYNPIPVGNRMLILPEWIESSNESRIPIKINPGMAFGTGSHPTTQLCIQALEEFIVDKGNIIDLGCGSGILSIAAILLGSDHALAVDIDEESIRLTEENAKINDVSSYITVKQGSIQQIRTGEFKFSNAPVVVVNILAPIIQKLLDEGLVNLVDYGGHLILSGILEEQEDQILDHPIISKMEYKRKYQQGDWLAMVFLKSVDS